MLRIGHLIHYCESDAQRPFRGRSIHSFGVIVLNIIFYGRKLRSLNTYPFRFLLLRVDQQ